MDYEYRVRTEQNLDTWLEQFEQAFPDARWEITSFAERSERLERLDQIATALILIAFTTLFIGGLGVANSIHAYSMKSWAPLPRCKHWAFAENR